MHKDLELRSEEHRKEFAEHRREFAEHRRDFAEHRRDFAEHRRIMAAVVESIHQTTQQLTENDRTLTALLVEMHEEQKQTRQERTDLREAVMRLSVIAEAHQDKLDEHDEQLRPGRS
jgi:septal ring factor EnvC (AmiA/AmiB activator)